MGEMTEKQLQRNKKENKRREDVEEEKEEEEDLIREQFTYKTDAGL